MQLKTANDFLAWEHSSRTIAFKLVYAKICKTYMCHSRMVELFEELIIPIYSGELTVYDLKILGMKFRILEP